MRIVPPRFFAYHPNFYYRTEKKMFFRQIFEPKLAQYSYLIGCQRTGEAIVIDPMRDIGQYEEMATSESLRITAAAETHIHADYVSGLREFAGREVKIYASDEGGNDWRYEWLIASRYNHRLLKHHDTFTVGKIKFQTFHTPGHTPEHLTFSVTDFGGGGKEPMGLLTGDFVFVGDVGRPDLLETVAGMKNAMEPSARELYRSILAFKNFPEFYQIWPAHGAGSACGKNLGAVPYSTVGYELRFSSSIQHATTEERFVKYILDGQPEPPLYFARMKRINKFGPPILGRLPEPKRLSGIELVKLANNTAVALIDTRPRLEFMKRHIPASLLSPWDRQFNTIAGCYVEENTPVYLIIEEHNLREAVRDLVNVGLDNIIGYAPPTIFREYEEQGGTFESIQRITFEEQGAMLLKNDVQVLDVRRADEFAYVHLPGSGVRLLPHVRLPERLHDLPPNQRYYVHCRTGSRAAVAAALLKRHGYDVVYVDGEFIPWMKTHSAES
jgi:hydroxyacylglutathione hydrolase